MLLSPQVYFAKKNHRIQLLAFVTKYFFTSKSLHQHFKHKHNANAAILHALYIFRESS